jgi:hypothetical protein
MVFLKYIETTFQSHHHSQNPPGATKGSLITLIIIIFQNQLRKLETMDEEINTYRIVSAQAMEQRQRTNATKKVYVRMDDSSSIMKSIVSGKSIRKRQPNSLCMPNNSDRLGAKSILESTTPVEQVTEEIPEEKVSVGVINKCRGCFETVILHFETRLDHQHYNINEKAVALKAVYRCRNAQCKKEFPLNPMWHVSVRPDDFSLQVKAQYLEQIIPKDYFTAARNAIQLPPSSSTSSCFSSKKRRWHVCNVYFAHNFVD